jgi:hypothetical protein
MLNIMLDETQIVKHKVQFARICFWVYDLGQVGQISGSHALERLMPLSYSDRGALAYFILRQERCDVHKKGPPGISPSI